MSPVPQLRCRVPTAAWRTPLDRKKTVLLPFLRPGHGPRPVPTMTSAKYPVSSFSDSRLQVQVALGAGGSPGSLRAVTQLLRHSGRMPG